MCVCVCLHVLARDNGKCCKFDRRIRHACIEGNVTKTLYVDIYTEVMCFLSNTCVRACYTHFERGKNRKPTNTILGNSENLKCKTRFRNIYI